MWEVLVRTPRGRNNPRKLSMLLATFFVAVFGYISLTTPIASAATDATWNGDNISYQGNTYSPVAADATLPVDIPSGSTAYQFTDQTQTPNLVYFIFFSAGTDNPKSAKEATYIRYTLNPPNSYINPNGKKTITLKPSEASASPKASDGTLSSSCTISGIGWIVCPLMNGISEGMDFIYARIEGFLSVQPITTSVNNPIYRIWMYSRDLANVAFIIAFLVIIYSYLVGGGFSGYEIRKILPRIILVAVLINVSYIICAAAVDMSNIAGHSVNQLFETVRDNALPGSAASGNVNWTSVTTWVLAGGSGAVASALILPGAVGGLGGLWLMLSTFLLGAVLVVMVTFLILAARQAIIIVLIAIAPLAFAAYVLPNTEKWFDKWKDLFFTMLIMFPAFGAVFGGAQLAGDLIIRMAVANGSIEQIILGLGVMVAPLAITPLLLKLSGGVLGRVGGLINNRQKGVYDRFKNHNEERRQQLIDRHRALNAERRINGDFGGGRFNPRTMVRRRAATNYARRNYREEQQKQDQEAAKNSWHRQNGRWGYDNHLEHDNFAERTNARNRIGFRQDGFGNLDTYMRRNAGLHDLTEAEHEEHWQNRLNGAAGAVDRAMLTDTRLSQGRGKVISGAFEAQDELTLQTALNTNPAYANLRAMKVQTTVDAGIAEVQKSAIEAAGKLALSNTVNADRALRQMKVQTFEVEKRAETIDNTLKKNAEAHWDYVSRTDAATQELRLREVQATDKAKLVQEQWNTLIENVAAKGGNAPNVAANSVPIANSIKGVRRDVELETRAQQAAKVVQVEQLAADFKASREGTGDPTLLRRAGGIGGDRAQIRTYAKAKTEMLTALMQEIKDDRSVTDAMGREQLKRMFYDGEYVNEAGQTVKVDEAMRLAAMYEITQKKGNNMDVEMMRDAMSEQGFILDEDTGKYYEYVRDNTTGEILRDRRNRPIMLPQNEITDRTEVERRRDRQQLFIDAMNSSPHVVTGMSGTNRSEFGSGTMIETNRDAFIRDIKGGKVKPERFVKADIDEMKLWLDFARDPVTMSQLSEGEKANLRSAIIKVQQSEQLRDQLEDRTIGIMNAVAARLDPRDTRPDNEKDDFYYVDEKGFIVDDPAKFGNPGVKRVEALVKVTPTFINSQRRTIQN